MKVQQVLSIVKKMLLLRKQKITHNFGLIPLITCNFIVLPILSFIYIFDQSIVSNTVEDYQKLS